MIDAHARTEIHFEMICKETLAGKLGGLGLWQGSGSIEPLIGGMTNRNYLVDPDGAALVARVCGELPRLGIDRRNEAACQTIAAHLGLAPELVHQEDGLLVSRHIPGQTLGQDDVIQPTVLATVMKAVKQLHDAWASVASHLLYFCPFQTIRSYARSAKDLGASLPDSFDAMVNDACNLERMVRPFRPVLCHNDLLPANLIMEGERIWIIDWEYAGMGHPFFDLASLSTAAFFTEDHDESMLGYYLDLLDEHHFREFRIYKAASALREALWGLVQSVASDIPFDYLSYADRSFDFYRRIRREEL